MKKITLLSLFMMASASAGIYEPYALWEKRQIKTCFYDDDSLLAQTALKNEQNARARDFVPNRLNWFQRKQVKKHVQKDFTAQRTGIEFVGFEDCKDMPNADLIVMKASSKIFLFDRPFFDGLATIGQSGQFGRVNGELGFYRRKELKAYIALKSTQKQVVIHEFGHTAGMRHEHIQPEARNDEKCHKRVVPLFKESNNSDAPNFDTETPYDTTVVYTRYDTNSIMNYCHMIGEAHKVKKQEYALSEKDLETLKAMYPY